MKKENFEHEMNEFIEANKDRQFKYGEWDCCIFTASIVKIISGKDYIKEFKYKTKKKAYDLIQKAGGLVQILDERFERLDNMNLAQRGDLCYKDDAIGICIGSKAIFVNKEGYSFFKIDECQLIYRI